MSALPIKLFTPGPTPVPRQVMEAMSRPMIHHRSAEFSEIFGKVRRQLSDLMGVGTQGQSLLFTSSGSGAMEAAVCSLFDKGDHVVVVESGKFGQRWKKLAQHFSLTMDLVEVEWGKTVTLDQIENVLTPTTKGVLIQACESSTGVFHPIYDLAKLIKSHSKALFVVDAITALGIHDLDQERDLIDVLIGGSQKALMCPPGLATMGLRASAIEQIRPGVGFYFSLANELKNQKDNKTAFTPAVSLVRGLSAAMDIIEAEGKTQVFARHKHMQTLTRAHFRKVGLELFNLDQDASLGITAVDAQERFDVKAWLTFLKKEYNMWLAGGQDHLEGKIFRFSHMGAVSVEQVEQALQIITESLSAAPFQVLGS
ncbi:MAG: alanine--glyoxylate aminotransferase family protein [Bdellovibrionota bacterium]